MIVPKWSGSLELGVTTQNPERLDYPETLSRVKTVFTLGDLEHLQVNHLPESCSNDYQLTSASAP